MHCPHGFDDLFPNLNRREEPIRESENLVHQFFDGTVFNTQLADLMKVSPGGGIARQACCQCHLP